MRKSLFISCVQNAMHPFKINANTIEYTKILDYNIPNTVIRRGLSKYQQLKKKSATALNTVLASVHIQMA
jgi:hypothetical protein